MGFEYIKGEKANEWLPKTWRLTTFPVANEPASSPNDIVGSAFLLQYQSRIYVVSARHVVEGTSLALVMPTKKETALSIPFRLFEASGLSWVHHPELDISAIVFPTPFLER